MKFFVDYENVHALGFRGAEFLTPKDEVVLFYSKACAKIERGLINRLYASGCVFSIFRLENTGRNALDFYITSHIGETLGRGYSGAVGIVSHDKGFKAIHDYWQVRNPGMKIVCNPDIARCIVAVNEMDDLRWQRVHSEYETLDLEMCYSDFEKRNLLRSVLEDVLGGPESGLRFDELVTDLLNRQIGRETYLALMHEYGVTNGQAIYRALKNAG